MQKTIWAKNLDEVLEEYSSNLHYIIKMYGYSMEPDQLSILTKLYEDSLKEVKIK